MNHHLYPTHLNRSLFYLLVLPNTRPGLLPKITILDPVNHSLCRPWRNHCWTPSATIGLRPALSRTTRSPLRLTKRNQRLGKLAHRASWLMPGE